MTVVGYDDWLLAHVAYVACSHMWWRQITDDRGPGRRRMNGKAKKV